MKTEAFKRALEVLGHLEEDPQGRVMSRCGAEKRIHQIAKDYVDRQEVMARVGLRPGKVRQELLEIAKKAHALAQALNEASDLAWRSFWMVDCIAKEEEVQGRLWLEKIRYLEALCNIAAEDPKLKDGGGGALRAEGRWFGTPNHNLVRQGRALLAACARPCSGSTGGTLAEKELVNLLSAIREVAIGELGEFTFTHDIPEVLRWPGADLRHEALVARFLLGDLQCRRPETDPDIQELELAISITEEKISQIEINHMASRLGLRD